MSRVRDVQRKIDSATERRRKAWAAGDAAEARQLSGRLEELYGELRLARARSRNGSPDQIVRRARVEREIEKLAAS